MNISLSPRLLSLALAATIPFSLTSCSGEEDASITVEAPAETADAAAQQWLDAAKNKNAAQLWNNLPASYQKDVNGLLKLASKKIDGELFSGLMEVAGMAGDVVANNPALIKDVMKQQNKEIPEDLDAVLAASGAFLTKFASDLSTTEKLGSLDVLTFLQSNGKNLKALIDIGVKQSGEDPFAMFAGATAKLKEGGDKHAVVEMTMDGKTEEAHFVKVDGRWVPEDMAKEWSQMMTQAKQGLENMPPMEGQMKTQLMGMMKSAKNILEVAKESATVKELQEEASRDIAGLMGSAGALFGPMMPGMMPSGR